jgi:hypothetical protein
MGVSCRRRILALWANHQKSNAWVWLTGAGWRKLDDRRTDATTNLLALAALAKELDAEVMVHEELRGDRWFVTEIYDFSHGSTAPAQEVSFFVTECIYGWTAAFNQKGTHITARIQLNPDSDVSATLLEQVKKRWKLGIENKWSYRYSCCETPGCVRPCALTFEVRWVTRDAHLQVRVKKGSGRSNLSLWHTNDSGDVASHEFGHLLGHPDEYSDPQCPDRSPVNTGTVMDNNKKVVKRLCEPFCERIGQDTTKA